MSSQFPTFIKIGSALKRAGRWSAPKLRFLGKFVLSLVILALVVDIVLGLVWGTQVRHKLAELKASGEPTTVADLKPQSIPDSENAAVLYMKAVNALNLTYDDNCCLSDFIRCKADPVEWRGVDTRRLARMGPPPAMIKGDKQTVSSKPSTVQPPNEQVFRSYSELESHVRQIIDKNRLALSLAENGAAKPKCIFKTDWSYGAGRVPGIEKLYNIARLISARGIIQSIDPEEKPFDDIATSLKISLDISSQPDRLTFVTGNVAIERSLDGLMGIINDRPLSVAQAKHMYDQLSKIDLQPNFVRSLQANMVLDNWCFDAMRRDYDWFIIDIMQPDWSPNYTPSKLDRTKWHVQGILQRPFTYKDQLTHLSIGDKWIKMRDLPYREVKGQAELIEKNYPRLFCMFSGWFGPSILSRLWLSRDISIAQIGLTQTALALKTYKSDHRAYPDSLSKLAWKIPDDPFSGKPFIYKRVGDGFKIYSIGFNLKDDGGITSEENLTRGLKDPNAFDIVWTSKK